MIYTAIIYLFGRSCFVATNAYYCFIVACKLARPLRLVDIKIKSFWRSRCSQTTLDSTKSLLNFAGGQTRKRRGDSQPTSMASKLHIYIVAHSFQRTHFYYVWYSQLKNNLKVTTDHLSPCHQPPIWTYILIGFRAGPWPSVVSQLTFCLYLQ